jgi:hypothetical protein
MASSAPLLRTLGHLVNVQSVRPSGIPSVVPTGDGIEMRLRSSDGKESAAIASPHRGFPEPHPDMRCSCPKGVGMAD